MSDVLADAIARAGASLSPAAVAALVDHLRRDAPGGVTAAQALIPVPLFRAAVIDLWGAWATRPEMPAAAVALALEASSQAAADMRNRQQIELVATGPSTQAVPVRETESVLLDVVGKAEHSLLLLSYAAYKVDSLVEGLEAALARGVSVRLLLEHTAAGNIDFSAADAFAPLRGRATILTWDLDARPMQGDRYAAMHAKAAVADRTTAFITSANLTGKALERNMELGVLIRGGDIPRQLVDHIDRLEADGVLKCR